MDELRKQIEAILFSVARYISVEELSVLCKKEVPRIKELLREMQVSYENDEKSSLVLLNDEDKWKLTVREEYANIVRRVVSETELSKTLLETLAVIAFKYPIKQSELIKIRTNKAYDHLRELEEGGFITRQRYGRSKLIKLTDKFFEYFDLPREKLKERFKGFGDMAKTIEKKEEEIEGMREEQRKAAEEAARQEEEERKLADGQIEVDLVDEKGKGHGLETYGKKDAVEEVTDKVGDLEVIDEGTDEIDEEKTEEFEENKEISGGEDIKGKEISQEEKDHEKVSDKVEEAAGEIEEKRNNVYEVSKEIEEERQEEVALLDTKQEGAKKEEEKKNEDTPS